MKIEIEILCKDCDSKRVIKNGKSKSGEQRYRCKDCNKTMQLNFMRNGDKPEIIEKIMLMAHNGNGVRQTSRILKISKTTVSKYLKKKNIQR